MLPTWGHYPFYAPFVPFPEIYPTSPTISPLALLFGISSRIEEYADWVQPNFGGGGGYNIGIPAEFAQYMMDAGVLAPTRPGWGTIGGVGIRILITAGGPVVLTVVGIGALATVGYILYQAKANADAEAADKADCLKLPDPTEDNFGKGPGAGWEWRPSGDPRGSWTRPTPGGGRESARPDRDLDGQHGNRPHWDYKGKNGTEWWGWGSGDCQKKPRSR
jgi:hypothetical protein